MCDLNIQKIRRAFSIFFSIVPISHSLSRVAVFGYHIFKLNEREKNRPMKIKINRKCAKKKRVLNKRQSFRRHAIQCNGNAYIWAIWINDCKVHTHIHKRFRCFNGAQTTRTTTTTTNNNILTAPFSICPYQRKKNVSREMLIDLSHDCDKTGATIE